MATTLTNLPTQLSSAGTAIATDMMLAWRNGQVVLVAPMSAPTIVAAILSVIPTTLPTTPGALWNNNGVLSVA
jgi:hypothetical protein